MPADNRQQYPQLSIQNPSFASLLPLKNLIAPFKPAIALSITAAIENSIPVAYSIDAA
jgi:hypothetical protein